MKKKDQFVGFGDIYHNMDSNNLKWILKHGTELEKQKARFVLRYRGFRV